MFYKMDLLTKKYMFLEELKVRSQEKHWNSAGRNFLGMWKIIPDGIRRFRTNLKKLPPRDFNILNQEQEINDLFYRTLDILKKKQMTYRFLGKRLVKTQEFYTYYYEEGLQIEREEKEKGIRFGC